MRSGLYFSLCFSFINCGPCPSGYSQASNGGDCFKVSLQFQFVDIRGVLQTINFHDYFSGNYFPTSFDEAEISCSNSYNGGLLASVHSLEV